MTSCFSYHSYTHRAINELEIKLSEAQEKGWLLFWPSPEMNIYDEEGQRMLITLSIGKEKTKETKQGQAVVA